jgi:hypothetical protein
VETDLPRNNRLRRIEPVSKRERSNSVAQSANKVIQLTQENVVVANRKGRRFERYRICRREAWRNLQKDGSTHSSAKGQ